MFKRAIPLPVAAALLAVAILITVGLVLAFTSDSSDHSTGTFSVQAENVDILVTELTPAGQPSPWSSSCTQTALGSNNVQWTCLASVQNLKTSGPVSWSLQKLSFDNADGLNLAGAISVQAGVNGTPASACTSNIGTSAPLSTYAGFGDPAPGTQSQDQVLNAQQTVFLCLKYLYTVPQPSPPFGATTSAVYRVSADDSPPFP